MKQAERKSSGINVGSASVIMLFSVLCLTIFSVLTFLTANNEYKLANKSAEAVKAYYAADTIATETYGALKETSVSNPSIAAVKTAAKEMGVNAIDEGAVTIFNYKVDVDGNQELRVELKYDGKDFTVTQWKLVNTAEWNAENSIKLWDGEF
ncbi:MAG: hypothetical protein GX241_05665 [Ruminococcaceae bacterium]|nr:hypothetical protein [Oscillospiraceae bacterium]